MMRKILVLIFLLPVMALAQKKAPLRNPTAPCSEPGTVPSKAIPVCGTTVFTQTAVTNCTGPNIAQPFCPDPFASTASYWYKFTCFSGGSLSFLITPNGASDDYDWALFDITGHNPDDVFTDNTLAVTINGAQPVGVPTGCDITGVRNFECYSSFQPMNKIETIIAGHRYLLMVTNFTNSGLGYRLSFGGSAVISDGVPPAIDHIESGCNSIKVYFTTDIKCNSITAAGSEFTLSPANAAISSVTSDCAIGFLAVNSLTINFATPLPAGTYNLSVKTGTDLNTLNNICDDGMPVGTNADFTVRKPIGNFTVAPENCLADPTVFTSLSDPLSGNTVSEWHWDFGDASFSTLQNPQHIYAAPGTYLVKHWIVNSLGCYSDTSVQQVIINDVPHVGFTHTAPECETRTIQFTDNSTPGTGSLATWLWDFGDAASSTQQHPSHTYAGAGTYNVKLTVSNSKGCIRTLQQPITINNRPQALFDLPAVCLNDTYAQFTEHSTISSGTIVAWHWNFGDPGSGAANTSTLQNPQHSYTATGSYNVELIVTSNNGCKDTVVQAIYVNGSFPVAGFNVNNPAALCANDSVSIVNTSSVFPGNITKIEIFWDDAGSPLFDVDNSPFSGKVYKHLYTNFQSPLTKTFTIRLRAYSGGVCMNEKLQNITVNAAPKVQFTNMADVCFYTPPFQITQATETGGVPGTYIYTGPGVSATGIFNPAAAGVGTHRIMYTYTSATGGCVDTMSNTITVQDTAHAKFQYTGPICDGVPGLFTDLSTAPAGITLANTFWDFGDGSPLEAHAPGTSFTHLFPTFGTYLVKMYNSTTYGCISTVYQAYVTVDPNHTLTLSSATATTDQELCVNNPILDIKYIIGGGATGVTVTGLPPGVGYTLVGSLLTIQGIPTLAQPTAYSYQVVTTGNTCVKASATGKILVKPDHTLILNAVSGNPVQRVCINTLIDPVHYTIGGGANDVAVTGLPPGVNYVLTGNTVSISGAPSSTLNSPYHYTITTLGNNCIQATASGTITVSPEAVPLVTPDKPGYCLPDAKVTFINRSTIEDGTTSELLYLWDFGEPSTGILNSSVAWQPMHQYYSPGPFTVKLRITSKYGCVHDTSFVLRTVHPQPHAQFSLNRPKACLGDEVLYTDKTDPLDGTTAAWFWDLGDGSLRNQASFNYTYTDTLFYKITLFIINSNGCHSDTAEKMFRVFPNPVVDAGPDRRVLQGSVLTLTPTVKAPEPQYVWTPNLYLRNNINTVKNPVVYDIREDVTYKLIVTDREGCVASDDIFIHVLKAPDIPNTFSPNGDGINDTWKIKYLEEYRDCRVQVFTRSGQLVFESQRGYPVAWDGMYKGKKLPMDTYYYIIEPGYNRDPVTGYVTLIY
ncbi:MAG: PKD domain-containing protein [Ferruginibacter sp.]